MDNGGYIGTERTLTIRHGFTACKESLNPMILQMNSHQSYIAKTNLVRDFLCIKKCSFWTVSVSITMFKNLIKYSMITSQKETGIFCETTDTRRCSMSQYSQKITNGSLIVLLTLFILFICHDLNIFLIKSIKYLLNY